MDLVSIIVPVYNVRKYLSKCLDSLVNQNFPNIEIIVVNDGSLDNSQEIITKYQNKYPHLIKSFLKKNGGLSSARNYGLSKAHGKYITFVDSDDYVTSDYIAKMYEVINKNNADVAICNYYMVKNNKEKLIKNYIPNKVGSLNEDKKQLFNSWAVWNKMFSRKIIEDHNLLFSENVIYEDFRFTLKVFLKSSKIAYVDEALYYYIYRENSIMNSQNLEKNKDILAGFTDILNYYQKESAYEEYKEEIEFLAILHILIYALVRVIKASKGMDIASNILPYLNYLNTNFPSYKQNKYLKTLSINHKLIYNLINKKQYFLLKLLIKVRG